MVDEPHARETPLLEALSAAAAGTPAGLVAFDRVAAAGPLGPDFLETSVRITPSSASPHRLTYYFDVHRRGGDVARSAARRLDALGVALGVPAPPALAAIAARDVPARPEVLQVVLGVEDPGDAASRRLKYYLVFRDAAGALARRLLGALGVDAPPSADLDRLDILGVDLAASGLADVKLYFRVALEALPRAAKNLADVSDLLPGTRYAVFQQCVVRPERRQIYLHASDGDVVRAHLDRRARGGHAGAAALLDRLATLAALRPALGLRPWILSYGYRAGRLDLDAGNVYLHLAPGVFAGGHG